MPIMVRDLPMGERPREKLIRFGAAALSNAELIAILLRTGTKERSVLDVAAEVLSLFQREGITELMHMTPSEMTKIQGLGEAKASAILAAVELGRRLSIEKASEVKTIRGPEDAAEYVMPHLRFEEREHFEIILLDTKNHILGLRDISTGSLSASIVHPREVFLAAIRGGCASIILVHNHPSGDPAPSREDIAITQRLVKAGALLDIPVLDHVIIGDGRFASLKEKGMMD